MLNPGRMILSLQQTIGRAVVGKEEAIEYALIALLCKGHVLIEDVPGVGKTTLASALAKSLDCSFRRIQFTPDLMPSDITGFTLVNFKTGEMEYKEGAVMSQIILADEINRTSPKTQSALLEVMEEIKLSTIFITHDVDEAILISDRIYIMKGEPAGLSEAIPVTDPKPRDPSYITSEEFVAYKKKIRGILFS